MDKNNLVDLIFIKWKASLDAKSSEQRSSKYVRSNFEELFFEWKNKGLTFDEVESYLSKAVKAHQPKSSLARNSYKTLKAKLGSRLDKSEQEYIQEWNENIESVATDAFFEFFPVASLDKDDEPKVYGNMSAREYRLQRQYADQFPTLDTTDLVKQWKEQQDNLNMNDIIENVLGQKDETNS